MVPERRDPLHRSMRPAPIAVVVHGQDGRAAGLLTDTPLVEAGNRWSVLGCFRPHGGRVEFDGQLHGSSSVPPRFSGAGIPENHPPQTHLAPGVRTRPGG